MVQNDKPIVKFLNIMVLLSSILVLVIISIELLSATTILSERFIPLSEYRIYFFRSSFPCHLGFTAFNSYRPGYLRYIDHRQLDDPQ